MEEENEENLRFKFVSGIDRQPGWGENPPNLSKRARCRTKSRKFLSLVSFEVLLFSNANWIVSSDHRFD